MDSAELMVRYRRFLKRRNYSLHTVKNYLNILGHFRHWLKMPFEEVTHKDIGAYTEHLLSFGYKAYPDRYYFDSLGLYEVSTKAPWVKATGRR